MGSFCLPPCLPVSVIRCAFFLMFHQYPCVFWLSVVLLASPCCHAQCNNDLANLNTVNQAGKPAAAALVALKNAVNAYRTTGGFLNHLQRAFHAASKAGVATGDSTYKSAEAILKQVCQLLV